MLILPAIDILNKQPVRLYQGDYQKKEVVGQSVLSLAKRFAKMNAKYLHLVDLDGAKEGQPINQDLIIEVAKTLDIPIEVGGGIRSLDDITYYLNQGVARVILGTGAIEDKQLLITAVKRYKDQIAVGIDCKNGYVYGHGWLKESKIEYIDFARELEKIGVKTIIVTDISKDGTLSGANIEMLSELKKQVSIHIIASGGIKNIEDIKRLKEMDMYGAITGKAIYHGSLDLKEALDICKED